MRAMTPASSEAGLPRKSWRRSDSSSTWSSSIARRSAGVTGATNGSSPASRASSCSSRAQNPGTVWTGSSSNPRSSSASTSPRIASAAASEPVSASTCSGATPPSVASHAWRCTSVAVLPVPAAPSRRTGPLRWVTTAACAGVSVPGVTGTFVGYVAHGHRLEGARGAPVPRLARRLPACRGRASGRSARASDQHAARRRDRRPRRGRRPDARHRRRRRGRRLLRARRPPRRRRALHRGLGGARLRRLRRPRRAGRHRPDRRLVERQARPDAPRAVGRGRRRADDGRRRVRLRLRPRAGRGVAGDARRRRVPQRRPARRSAARAPAQGRQARAARDRVGEPPVARRVLRRAAARHGARPRDGLDRDLALPGRGDPRRRHGDPVELPRGRRRRRAARRARERRLRRVHRVRRPAVGAARPSAPLARRRLPHRGGARRAHHRARLRPRGDDLLVIDWTLAERIAGAVAGSPNGETAKPLPGDLAAMADEARVRVGAYARLEPGDTLPPPEAVDRGAWTTANLRTMRGTLDPLVSKIGGGDGPLAGPLKPAGGVLLAGEIGGIVGFMARHVLGQYELALLDPTQGARLLLVAPNLHEAARAMDVELDELLPWVVFHEVTHAVQFNGVPRLREHLAGILRELLSSMQIKIDPSALLKLPSMDDLRGLWDQMREGGFVTAVAGPERKALMDRLQATMAMIEGHAEHVMDAAGAPVLPNVGKLRAAMDRRRKDRPPAFKLLERLLGLDMKM